MNKPVKWRPILIGAIVIAVVALAVVYRDQLDKDSLVAAVRRLPTWLFLLAFLILPLVGVPISIFLIAAGLRFGFVGGMASAAACIACHHAAAYGITHGSPRERVHRWLEHRGHRVPRLSHKDRIRWTAIFAAVSGPPYAMKLYGLALTDLPFKIYGGVGIPIYILMGSGIVAGGAAASKFNVLWIPPLIALLGAAFYLGRALRKKAARSGSMGGPE